MESTKIENKSSWWLIIYVVFRSKYNRRVVLMLPAAAFCVIMFNFVFGLSSVKQMQCFNAFLPFTKLHHNITENLLFSLIGTQRAKFSCTLLTTKMNKILLFSALYFAHPRSTSRFCSHTKYMWHHFAKHYFYCLPNLYQMQLWPSERTKICPNEQLQLFLVSSVLMQEIKRSSNRIGGKTLWRGKINEATPIMLHNSRESDTDMAHPSHSVSAQPWEPEVT